MLEKSILILFIALVLFSAPLSAVAEGENRLDLTPPTTPVVIDDGDFTYNNTQLHASWSSTDPESGIAKYKYAIGTGPGLIDVVGWTLTGKLEEITHTGLSLITNETYYFTVKAQNCAFIWSEPGYSDGITVKTNSAPVINSIIPADHSLFTEGEAIMVVVTASDPDGERLEYRFLVNGDLKQDWSPSKSYVWQAQQGELFEKTIEVEVRDKCEIISGQTHVFLSRKVPTP